MVKTSLCVAVMILNIKLQINNEYSYSAVDQTCKYKVRINCNFIIVDSLLSIYNENVPVSHQPSLGNQTIKRNNLS